MQLKRNDKISAWSNLDKCEREKVLEYASQYRNFLDENKTEREFVDTAKKLLEEQNFINLRKIDQLKTGDRVYLENKNKNIIAIIIGKDFSKGFNIIGTHIDSPRLDLKIEPLFEDGRFSFFNTHYYGMVKKYQWLTIPLALHGVIVKEDGSQIKIKIGEEKSEPVFYISDLLPHISSRQMKEEISRAINADHLNVINGSIKEENLNVKDNILSILDNQYGIKYEDFISAELQFVPALKTRDVGFDKGLVGGYGHDDRVSAYAALKAILDVKTPEHTVISIFVDREEIGSIGATGMCSNFFERTLAEIIKKKENNYEQLQLLQLLEKSSVLSVDVVPAYDRNFKEYFDFNTSALMGNGIVITRDTGIKGKENSAEPNAEFIAEIRRLFNKNNVYWQTGEFGKVDVGGGGTIGKFLSNRNSNVLDCGPSLLSMHSPFELVSKVDMYQTYKAIGVFINR